jgi:hypothetical protein
MNNPAITTIEQSFIADDEPLAQLTSALFQLLNDAAFDVLPHHSINMVLSHVLDHRGDGGLIGVGSVSELIPGFGGVS